MIKFENLNWTFKGVVNPTLKDINLNIDKNERVLIVGPSGSGKSTLGYIINGLIPNSYKGKLDGNIYFNGTSCKELDLNDISMQVGTVMQDTDGQFVGLTVAEDIAFSLENQCCDYSTMHEKVLDCATLVDMQDHLDSSPMRLSGGQKQRVSLSGVLVDDVPILLFDEPLANLDPKASATTMKLIDDIATNQNKTIVIIEHRIEEVLECKIDKVILVYKGNVVAVDSIENLLFKGILPKYGIREPLYIKLLKLAKAPITLDVCRNVSFVDKSYKNYIDKWLIPYKEHDSQISANKIVEFKNVTFSYTGCKNALEDISFSINSKEMISILGKNGSGKSTLANLLMGIYTPDKGQILINGEDVVNQSVSHRSSYIGYVMQNPNHMISHSLVKDEVAFALKLRGLSEEEINKKVTEVLTVCELYSMRNWPIVALSYGQKKRVTIASILVLEPKILILDEPTSAQDYHHYTQIMEFITKIHKLYDMTIICITHDMHLSLEYTTRSLVFCDGSLIANKSTWDLHSSQDILAAGHLKQTSLYELATVLGYSEKETASLIYTFNKEEEKERENDTKN